MKKGFLSLFTALTMSLFSIQANAVLITSDGIWNSITETGTPNVDGAGTDTILWGTAVNAGNSRSAWSFIGLSNFDAGDITDGSEFELGTFRHKNSPITGGSITGADLVLDLTIGGNNLGPLTFTFGHDETPNSGTCARTPLPGFGKCPDIVSIPMATAMETIIIDAIAYELTIEGFKLSAGGPTLSEFVTQEKADNRAQLYGSLSRAVPEPSVLALFGLGLLGLGFASRRRR